MSLRVLLADESTTIKKVINLTLKEFFVEVKAVPVGLDVVPLAKAFQPDIIFVDVLLQKQNGYDVCINLRADPDTKKIPIVLMWSGFMELDSQKAEKAMPDAKLEKPFDSQALRDLVEKLVPKLSKNPMKGFLTFPDRPDFSDNGSEKFDEEKTMVTQIREIEVAEGNEGLQLGSPTQQSPKEKLEIPGIPTNLFNDNVNEEFSFSKLGPVKLSDNTSAKSKTKEDWKHQDLGAFKLDIQINPDDADPVIPKVSDEDVKSVEFVTTASYIKKDPTKEKLPPTVPPIKFQPEIFPGKTTAETESMNKTNFTQNSYTAVDTERSQVKVSTLEPGGVKPSVEEVNASAGEVKPSQEETNYKIVSPEKVKQEIDSKLNAIFSESKINEMIQTQIKEVVESVVWKFIPDIAEKIIREELQKLLAETEKNIQGTP